MFLDHFIHFISHSHKGKGKAQKGNKGKRKTQKGEAGKGKGGHSLLRSNSTRQPDRPHERTHGDTKRFLGWTHPQPQILFFCVVICAVRRTIDKLGAHHIILEPSQIGLGLVPLIFKEGLPISEATPPSLLHQTDSR